MPLLLGYLTDNVGAHEIGALQGAADTVRTIAAMLGSPLFARLFGHFIEHDVEHIYFNLLFMTACSVLGLLVFSSTLWKRTTEREEIRKAIEI
jgi:hypothetical protein